MAASGNRASDGDCGGLMPAQPSELEISTRRTLLDSARGRSLWQDSRLSELGLERGGSLWIQSGFAAQNLHHLGNSFTVGGSPSRNRQEGWQTHLQGSRQQCRNHGGRQEKGDGPTRGAGPRGLCRRAAQPQDSADKDDNTDMVEGLADLDLRGRQALAIPKDRGFR